MIHPVIDGASPCFERCQSSRWRQESSISLLREFLASVLPQHASRWFDISSRVSVRWRNLGDVHHNKSPQFWRNRLKNGTTRKAKQQLLSLRVVPSSSIPYRFGVFDAAFAVAFPDGFFCSLDLLPDLAPWGWLPFVIIELLAT
jgi:hypothetical protein